MKTLLLAGFGAVALARAASANPYDDCILQYMGKAQDRGAVYAIERACISKTTVPIPNDPSFAGLSANLGSFNMGFGSLAWGLVITLKNTTAYSITQVKVFIRNKATKTDAEYVVDKFDEPLPVGTVLSGLGEPYLEQVIRPGQTQSFFTAISEVAKSADEFGKKYDWFVIPTQGIPN
jgi:hypothetical protein